MRSRVFLAASVVLALTAAGCAPKPVAPPAVEVTIQSLMDQKIDPSADALWESVGTVETAKGVEVRGPANDAQWNELEAKARLLIDGARQLAKARTAGGDTHSPLADADTPGIRTPAQISADIKADPARFEAAAGRLQSAGEAALAAIHARDSGRFLEAGAQMDAACEACHAAYWYPRGATLPLPDDRRFAAQAIRP